MAEVLTLINRLIAPFKNAGFNCDIVVHEVREKQADMNRRLDRLEAEIKRAEMDGEERWFLASKRREDRG